MTSITQQQVLNSNGPDAARDELRQPRRVAHPAAHRRQAGAAGRGAAPRARSSTRWTPARSRWRSARRSPRRYPYDAVHTAAGLNDFVAERASTILPPSVPGYKKYEPFPDLTGTGSGDPAGAKAMLEAAGKVGFELSWYYDNTTADPAADHPDPHRRLQGRRVRRRSRSVSRRPSCGPRLADYDAPVNMGQSPGGWCSDWPTGGSWFPVLFQTHSIADGSSWGMLSDAALDAKIDDDQRAAGRPSRRRSGSELDKEDHGHVHRAAALLRQEREHHRHQHRWRRDATPTMGMPFFNNIFVKSP